MHECASTTQKRADKCYRLLRKLSRWLSQRGLRIIYDLSLAIVQVQRPETHKADQTGLKDDADTPVPTDCVSKRRITNAG
jgi:hypothetical protein